MQLILRVIVVERTTATCSNGNHHDFHVCHPELVEGRQTHHDTFSCPPLEGVGGGSTLALRNGWEPFPTTPNLEHRTLNLEHSSPVEPRTLNVEHSVAFIGAGAVVTKDVPDHALVAGNPAKQIGWMCICGEKLDASLHCPICKKQYQTTGENLQEIRK